MQFSYRHITFLGFRLRQISVQPFLPVFTALMLLVCTMCTPTYHATRIDQQTQEIKALDAKRIRAMIEADTNTLNLTLHSQLKYVHTNGVAENKAEFLQAISSGKYKFTDFQLDSVRYFMKKNTVIANGSARIDVFAFEKRYKITTRYTAVYLKQPHWGWQLYSWQNTKTGEW
jgi:hypothetical protein